MTALDRLIARARREQERDPEGDHKISVSFNPGDYEPWRCSSGMWPGEKDGIGPTFVDAVTMAARNNL